MSYDLLQQPWLRRSDADRQNEEKLGLIASVTDACEIRAICGDTPLQTAAILRLSIALVRRAYNITSASRWRHLWSLGGFPAQDLHEYLAKPECINKFDLVSPTNPFYQCAGLVTDKLDSVNRLAPDAASGNNPTLFDHRLDTRPVSYTAAEAARMVIAAQLYSPGGGVAGRAVIAGREYGRPNLTHGAAFSGATYWISGRNWFETLMLNVNPLLSDGTDHDQPWWERDDWSRYLSNSAGGRTRLAEHPEGIYDRLTWQARLLRLLPTFDRSGNITFQNVYYTQGRAIDSQAFDPMKADRRSKSGWYPMQISAEKAGWRNVHAILQHSAIDENNTRPPEAINTAYRLIKSQSHLSSFVLEAVGADADQAKLILWRHDRLSIPKSLLSDPNLVGRISVATDLAEARSLALRARLLAVCELYVALDRSVRKPDKKDVARIFASIDTTQQYWAALEATFQKFLIELGRPEAADVAVENWTKAVNRQYILCEDRSLSALGQSKRALMARGKAASSNSTTLPEGKRKKGVQQ